MKNLFKLFIAVFALGVVLTACSKGSDGEIDKFKIDPKPVMEDAIKNKKFLILIFESADCKFCTKLHKEVLNDFEVKQKLIKNNVAIAIINVYGDREVFDPEDRKIMNEQILAYVYRVQMFPTIIIFDPNKNYKKLAVIPGFVPKDKFINILDYLGSGCYEKVPFQKWLEKRSC